MPENGSEVESATAAVSGLSLKKSTYIAPHLRAGGGPKRSSDGGSGVRSYGKGNGSDYNKRSDNGGQNHQGSYNNNRWSSYSNGHRQSNSSNNNNGLAKRRTPKQEKRVWRDFGDSPGRFEDDPFKRSKENAEVFVEMNTGINFDKYDEIPVEVSGMDDHTPVQNFAESDLHGRLLKNIELAGYSKPTPVQRYSIPIVTGNRDLMACAQTGSGKTAGFLLPVIQRMMEMGEPPEPPENAQANYRSDGPGYRRVVYPTVLILAPTRELAVQIYEESRKFTYQSGIRPCVVYGGAEFREQRKQMERGCDVLVATPGRLVDMVERGKLSLETIRFLVLDEADRMLDMGFEPQIRNIVEKCGMPHKEERLTLMFSATFPKEIQALASDFLGNYVFLTVGRVGSTTDSIVQKVEFCPDHRKSEKVIQLLSTIPGLTLVFVETKRGADVLEDFLTRQGFPATSIHGDRSQNERLEALHAFRTGLRPILVATDVAARGLDIPNVTHVINYDLPGDIDDYVHRIGRTGRAGNTGLATALVNEKNRNIVRDMVDLLSEAQQEVPEFLTSLARSAASGGGKKRSGNSRFGGKDFRKDSGYHGGGGGGGRQNNGYGGGRGEKTGNNGYGYGNGSGTGAGNGTGYGGGQRQSNNYKSAW